jgi:transcription initiation factor IIF auxiliary subunit
MPKAKKIVVIHRKLGKERAVGLYNHNTAMITVDSDLKGKEYLSTLLHEIIHHVHPTWAEARVLEAEKVFCNILWDQGFRKVEL